VTSLYVTQGPTGPSYLETEMFSARRLRPGRGWDAPAFHGINDLLDDSRSRLELVSARAAYQEALFGRATLAPER